MLPRAIGSASPQRFADWRLYPVNDGDQATLKGVVAEHAEALA